MKYKLTSEQISSRVAGEVVILNHNKGAYYGLDDVGALVWDSLEKGPQTIDQLCETVIGEYDIDADACREDIDALLKDLISEQLVQIVD
jgi:hypothetical protein